MHKSRQAPMNVILVVVAVVLSCTLEYSQARDGDITSGELCEQLKSNKRRVLTMGARGRSQEDAHFYILMEGGYMFKVPLANLHVDAKKRTTSLTIDREFIQADVYFNVSRDIFSRDYLFFLISNRNKDAFLGQTFYYKELRLRSFKLYDLNGVLRTLRDHQEEIFLQNCDSINVMGSTGIDSYSTYGFELKDKKLYRMYDFEENLKDELEMTEKQGLYRFMMNMSSNTKLVTVFYHKEDPNKKAGYYYFLDADGFITVTRREDATEYVYDTIFGRSVSRLYSDRFEVKLSSFVVCDCQTAKSDTQRPQSSPKPTTNTTAQTGPPSIYHRYWTIPLGIGAILVLGGIALYWFKRPQRKKKKKNKPSDDSVLSSLGTSNISSNLNSSNDSSCAGSSISSFKFVSNPSSTSSLASSASSALQSVKSKIVSLLKGNKSKLAKAVTKEKKSKVKPKSKAKDKSPRSP